MKIKIDDGEYAEKQTQTFLQNVSTLKSIYIGGIPSAVADQAKLLGRIMTSKR